MIETYSGDDHCSLNGESSGRNIANRENMKRFLNEAKKMYTDNENASSVLQHCGIDNAEDFQEFIDIVTEKLNPDLKDRLISNIM